MANDVLDRLTGDWKDLREIVVYGFGKVAQRNIDKLYRDFSIAHIIDNGIARMSSGGQRYRGIKIESFQERTAVIAQYKIIVCTSSLAYASIPKRICSPLG